MRTPCACCFRGGPLSICAKRTAGQRSTGPRRAVMETWRRCCWPPARITPSRTTKSTPRSCWHLRKARRRWRGCCTRRAGASEDEFMKSGWIIAVALVLSLTACEKDGPATPAPIGDLAALEKLAKNYEAISEQLTVRLFFLL